MTAPAFTWQAFLNSLPEGTDLRGPMPTEQQLEDIASSRIHSLWIELRDPFGQPINKWRLRETHPGYGGAHTLGAFMWAFRIHSIDAPFVVPGMDLRAPFYFHITHPDVPKE